VVPRRLVESGFTFRFPEWKDAVYDLVRRQEAGARESG
jgi:NAD dependent epimerase/dehydratase family enzyme